MQTSRSFDSKCGYSFALPVLSDEKLIGLISQKQDQWQAAFASLVERYRAWIYKRCLMRLGNPSDAEDATQDVILRLYHGLGSFEGRGSFLGWLYRVIDNHCNTFAMRQAKYQPTERLDQLIEQFQVMHSQETDSMETVSQVRRTLAALPMQARDILQLRFFKGCSLKQISELLGISLSAAKMRLYRALEQFKRLYIEINDTDNVQWLR